MKFGFNMFGTSLLFEEDPEDFLKKMNNSGYSQIELCVALDQIPGMELYFWSLERLEKYRCLIRKMGFEIISCHILAEDYSDKAPIVRELAAEYGISQFVTGCPRNLEEENLNRFSEQLKTLAKEMGHFGTELLLHNNYQEIQKKIAGVSAYEWVLSRCGGLVKAQVDVGWLSFGGVDPVAFIWENQSLIRSFHYKDVTGTADEADSNDCNICLGKGNLDVLSCFQFARYMGIPQLIDQDKSKGSLMEDLKDSIILLQSFSQRRDGTKSILSVIDTQTGEIRDLHAWDQIVEAPNWLPDGNTILFNSEGRIFRYRITEDQIELLETGLCDNCNNDHLVSWDGDLLAVSHSPKGSWDSQVYILPAEGGAPVQITKHAPCFLHGWSVDKSTLAYTFLQGPMQSGLQADICTISLDGSQTEKNLTNGNGFHDGSEYDPDGRNLWYNSTRSGLMQIWKMGTEGQDPQQMTFEEQNQWFPHISRDGKQVLHLVFQKDHLEPEEHLPNMQAELWIMNADGSAHRKICSFLGGQGSINVNSWSPDHHHAAFIRYEWL